MSSVVNVRPTQKDVIKEFLPPPDETTEVVRDWGHGGWVMRPRRCLKRRLRYCPYDVISAWRSFRKLRSLFNDFPLMIVPGWDETTFTKTSQNRVKINVEESKEENTHSGEKDNQEAAASVNKENNKDEQCEVNITVNKDCNKDRERGDKKWQIKDDADSHDKARPFTEAGEHGNVPSLTLRQVTTLRPHLDPDAMPESANREELESRHKYDKPPASSVTTVNSDKLEPTGDKTVTNDPVEESKTTQAEATTEEEQKSGVCGD